MTTLVVWLCALLWVGTFAWVALNGATRTQGATPDVHEDYDLIRLASQVHYEIEREARA